MGCSGSKLALGSSKRVVIIGGGIGGTALARNLDVHFQVTLVEAGEAFLYKIGWPRALIDEAFGDACTVPFDRLLENGKVITGDRAAEITEDSVTLTSGAKLEFDYLIVAVGAGNLACATEPKDRSVAGTKAYFTAMRAAVAEAKSIVIVGGGPIGIELAGEIRDKHPTATITIVHSGAGLCHVQQGVATPAAVQAKLAAACAQKNIALRLGVRTTIAPDQWAAMEKDGFSAGQKQLTLSDGTTLESDLVLCCVGLSAPESTPAARIKGVTVDATGGVKVNTFLQVEGYAKGNVFAIGDCASTGQFKMAGTAGTSKNMPFGLDSGHADLCFTNLAALEQTPPAPLTAHAAVGAPKMVIPVGRGAGAAMGVPGLMAGMILKMKAADFFLAAFATHKRYDRPVLPASK
jgi:NADH dehydrogenase FAD-containing subunit